MAKESQLHTQDKRRLHVGYYLVGGGQNTLTMLIKVKKSFKSTLTNHIHQHRLLFYVGNITLLSVVGKDVLGKLFGDKGYIGQGVFNKLFFNGIHLLTTVRRNMKDRYMTINDRIILRKRAIIESINNELKNICQIEHTRHRSFNNFIANLISSIAAYCFLPKKPAINVQFEMQQQLFLF